MKYLQLSTLFITAFIATACDTEWDKLNKEQGDLSKQILIATNPGWLAVACPHIQKIERRLVEIAKETGRSYITPYLNGKCDEYYRRGESAG